MELNDPLPHEAITLNGVACFCDDCNLLALKFLQTARDALKPNLLYPNDTGEKSPIVESLEKFLRHSHRRSSSGCKTRI